MTSSRRVPLRQAEAPPQATFLELFFDLALVFAFFQVSRTPVQQLNWSAALQDVVLFVVVWRIWFMTTWVTDRLDQDWWPVQLSVILTLTAGAILAAAIPRAFGADGLIFAGLNVGIRMGRSLFLAIVLRGHDMQHIGVGGVVWAAVSLLLWIAGGLTHAAARGVLWALGVAVGYFAMSANFHIPGTRRKGTREAPSRTTNTTRARAVVTYSSSGPRRSCASVRTW